MREPIPQCVPANAPALYLSLSPSLSPCSPTDSVSLCLLWLLGVLACVPLTNAHAHLVLAFFEQTQVLPWLFSLLQSQSRSCKREVSPRAYSVSPHTHRSQAVYTALNVCALSDQLLPVVLRAIPPPGATHAHTRAHMRADNHVLTCVLLTAYQHFSLCSRAERTWICARLFSPSTPTQAAESLACVHTPLPHSRLLHASHRLGCLPCLSSLLSLFLPLTHSRTGVRAASATRRRAGAGKDTLPHWGTHTRTRTRTPAC